MDSFGDDFDEMLTDLVFNNEPDAPPSADGYLERKRKAIEAMSTLFHKEEGKNVSLIVLVDATESMDRYIQQARNGVYSMWNSLTDDLNCALQVAVVAYRDPVDSPTDVHEVHPFTNRKIVFQRYMKGITAKGGGDIPEDWAGGMEKVNELATSVPADDKLIVCHIADAPPHGFSDDGNHNTEEQRTRLRNALVELKHVAPIDMEYRLFPVNNTTYVNGFRRFCNDTFLDGWFNDVFGVVQSTDFKLAFQSSIFESVTKSSSTAAGDETADVFGLIGLNKRVTPDDEEQTVLFGIHARDIVPPSNASGFVAKLKAYTDGHSSSAHEFANSFRGFATYLRPPSESAFSAQCEVSREKILFINVSPFAKGGERFAYKAKCHSGITKEMYETLCTSPDAINSLRDGEDMVVKFSMVPRSLGFAESKMAVHVAAMGMVHSYNSFVARFNLDLKPIRVLPPTVVSFPSDTTRMKKSTMPCFVLTKKLRDEVLVAEPMLKGEFVKFIINNGKRNTAVFDGNASLVTLDFFILFCFLMTKSYVPSDLQGTVDLEQVWVTDLAATCRDPVAFEESGTNLGESYMLRIVKGSMLNASKTTRYQEVFGPTGHFKNAHAFLEAQTQSTSLAPKRKRHA